MTVVNDCNYDSISSLGATCNHVAAVLFKVDHAWKEGWTNKACTSKPCVWNHYGAKGEVLDIKPVGELDWRKPHYKKKRGKHDT
jgi:hypothetical protein